MKTNNISYNIHGYLNTASLLRDKIITDEYLLKSIKSYKNSLQLRQKTIDLVERKKSNTNTSPIKTLPSIKTSNDTLSMLYSLRDNNNKKLFTGFNYNEKFDELKSRKKINKSVDKAIIYENNKLKERIKRIHSPLSRNVMMKDYDQVSIPVMKRIKKIYPNETLHLKIKKMQQKVKMLNLK